jgi:hypothetical protein
MSDDQNIGQSAPPPAPTTDFAERFRTAQSASQQSIERAGTRADKDRTKIAVTIMGVFAGSVAVSLLLLTVRGFANPFAWVDVTKDVADVIKTSVLPIVTLMLGYYFGTSGRS